MADDLGNEKRNRPAFEYRHVEFDNHKSFGDVLNPLAADGWRVIQIDSIAVAGMSVAYLERELIGE